MARSTRKSPVFTNVGTNGQKRDKQAANRKFRRQAAQAIASGEIDSAPVRVREVSNVWDWSGDGKQWASNPREGWERK
jgi:hypothetical protein